MGSYMALSVGIFVFCRAGLLFLSMFMLVLSGSAGPEIRRGFLPSTLR